VKKIILQVCVAAATLGFVAVAGAWQGPAQQPPAGNVAAPVNLSGVAQSKQGTLGVGGLGVFGRAFVSRNASYMAPRNVQVGIDGLVSALGYCDGAGQNCVSSLGRPVTASSTTATSSIAWVDLPAGDTGNFDTSCEYRWRITGRKVLGFNDKDYTYYANTVTPTQIIWGLSNDSIVYVPSNDKTAAYITPYGKATAWGMIISKVQRRC
jgi:hypothetical protein